MLCDSSLPQRTESKFLARWGILLLAIYAVTRSLFYAKVRPFWLDETLTYIVSRQRSLSAIRTALQQGVDGNPPAFYCLERFAAFFSPDPHLGYRLLSAFGFGATLLFLFIFVRTRYGPERALLSSALLLITPLFTLYAEEARPYSLVTAAIALALVCYQRLPSPRWTIGLFLSLLFAALMHYYAVIALLPFFLAESWDFIQTRRIRVGVWLAFFAAMLPVLLSFPILIRMKQNWGPHFWAHGATLSTVSATYGDFFRLSSAWGTALCGLSILAILSSAPLKLQRRSSAPSSETLLALGLILLPIVGFAIAKITHGPFVPRYFLCSILGLAIATIYGLCQLNLKALLAAALLISLAIASQEIGFWRTLRSRQTAADILAPIAQLAANTRYADLPIVISDSGQYLEIVHYAPASLITRVVNLPDPASAATYVGIDTVDKLALALRPYGLTSVQDLETFKAAHSNFLLYSDGGLSDWLCNRLLHDGYRLTLLEKDTPASVFLVAPQSAPPSIAAPHSGPDTNSAASSNSTSSVLPLPKN